MTKGYGFLFKAFVIITASWCIAPLMVHAQIQKGMDIDGDSASWSGASISMPDGNTIAIGARNADGLATDDGQVRVYTWNGSAWVQKGGDIVGEAGGDQSGYAVSMPNVNTLAIGAPGNSDNGSHAGHVRVYTWNGSVWGQKGGDIDGDTAAINSGWYVSMPDANTVAVGAPDHSHNGFHAGQVRVYAWNGSAWIQKGNAIDGEAAGDLSGSAVSMPDANTVAIGAHYNNGNGSLSGHTRVYAWNGSAWIQKGMDIDGATNNSEAGFSVSMPDSNTVGIGAPFDSGGGINAGQVRIYVWNGGAWVQKGTDIVGEDPGDQAGWSVSMPDPDRIAVGAPLNDGNGYNAGQMRIYAWDGSAWVQQGADIDGEALDDACGRSVSMPDFSTAAVGTPTNDGNGFDAGHVRIYSVAPTGINTTGAKTMILSIHPNPTSGKITLEKTTIEAIAYEVKDIAGKSIEKGVLANSQAVLDLSACAPGTYVLEFSSRAGTICQEKILKK